MLYWNICQDFLAAALSIHHTLRALAVCEQAGCKPNVIETEVNTGAMYRRCIVFQYARFHEGRTFLPHVFFPLVDSSVWQPFWVSYPEFVQWIWAHGIFLLMHYSFFGNCTLLWLGFPPNMACGRACTNRFGIKRRKKGQVMHCWCAEVRPV